MIELIDVSLSFGDNKVLDGLNLDGYLVEVLRRAIRVRTEDRFRTVEDLMDNLRGLLAEPAAEWADISEVPTDRLVEGEREGTPSTVPETATVLVDSTVTPNLMLGRRRLRLEEADQQLTLGDGEEPIRTAARVRMTMLADEERGARLHIKGLNCFVARAGARPSSGLDLWEDEEVELLSPARERLERFQVNFGDLEGDSRTFALEAGTVVVSPQAASRCLVLDFGADRELLLLYRRD